MASGRLTAAAVAKPATSGTATESLSLGWLLNGSYGLLPKTGAATPAANVSAQVAAPVARQFCDTGVGEGSPIPNASNGYAAAVAYVAAAGAAAASAHCTKQQLLQLLRLLLLQRQPNKISPIPQSGSAQLLLTNYARTVSVVARAIAVVAAAAVSA